MVRPFARAFAAVAVLLAAAAPASAQLFVDYLWTGAAVQQSGGTATNWNASIGTMPDPVFINWAQAGNGIPASQGGINRGRVTFNSNVGTTNVLNYNLTLHDLVFGTSAGAFTINSSGGSAFTFGTVAAPPNPGTGTITVSGAASQVVNPAIVVANTLTVTTTSGSGTLTLGGPLSGTADLVKTGTGAVTLGGNSTAYGGAVIVSNGTLAVASANALGNTTGTTTVAAGGTLNLNGQAVGAEPVSLTGTGFGAGGALRNTSAAAASLTGPVTIAADGTLIATSTAGGITLSGGLVTTAPRSLSVNALSSGVALTGSASTVGLLTVNVSATSSSVGLRLGNSDALGATANVVVASTTGGAGETGTRVSLFNNVSLPAGVSLSLPSNATGDIRSTLLNEAGTNTFAGPIGLSGTTGNVNLSASAGTMTLSGGINSPAFAGALQLRGGGTGTLSGVVTLAATALLNKSDGGTWVIATTGNTWGTLQPQTGTIRLDVANALPAGSAVNFTSNGTLNLNDNSQSITNLTGAVGSSLQLGTANLTSTGTANTTFAGVMSGVGGTFTKDGTNTLILTGDNTFTGNTTVNGGTLQLGNNSNAGGLAGNVVMGAGATLTYNRGNDFAYAGTYSGAAGAGSIRKTNTGVLTLTGSSPNFSGIWDIENGVVAISDASSLGGSGLTLEVAGSGGQSPELRLSNGIALAVAELRTSGPTALRNAGGNNSITSANGVLLNNGSGASTWISDAGTLTINGNVTGQNANVGLTLAGAGNGVVTNVISNGATADLPLTKTGAGTWTLLAANTYTGATTISGGTLVVPTGASLAAGSAVTVQGGTLAGNGTVNGTVAVTSTGRLAPGTSIGELTVGSTTLAGGGSYQIEYQSASADPTTPGTTHDHLRGTTGSSLDLTGVTSGNKFVLDLLFVESGNPTGGPATFVFATFDTITGATPGDVSDLFTVTGQLAASFTPTVTLTDGATDTLSITFVPVPEPATVFGLTMAAVAAGRLVRRRRGN